MQGENPFHNQTRDTYCVFYIVRHGQTEYNLQKKVAGHINIQLTEEGLRQAKELSESLKNVHFDAIYSSDLARAEQTAKIVALERDLAVITSKAIREKNYGDFEGKNQEDLKKIFGTFNSLTKDQAANYRVAPNAETDQEVMSRFLTLVREIAFMYKGKTVLIASHHALMRAFLIHIGMGTYKNFPPNSIKNTAYIKVLSDGIDFYLEGTDGVTII